MSAERRRMPQACHVRGLYAISNGPRDDLLEACAAALVGGASVLQYRDKTGDRARQREEASELAGLCRSRGVPLIINDNVDLARAVGADGVHLGADDADPRRARALLGPQAIIGASCYDSLDRARAATEGGADYLAFGAFFPSPSKPAARRADPDLLRRAASFGLPRVAIGGVTADNGAALIDAGADALAVISAVFGADDVAAASRRLTALFHRES